MHMGNAMRALLITLPRKADDCEYAPFRPKSNHLHRLRMRACVTELVKFHSTGVVYSRARKIVTPTASGHHSVVGKLPSYMER